MTGLSRLVWVSSAKTRVEESGIYFYQLLYRAVNAGHKPIAIYDQNISLTDSATQQPIEQVQCWNWQKVSAPCNRVEAIPKGEVVKEVRFGYSTKTVMRRA